jgi:sulfite exporter TauE/SafE/copper chaperone CopZ
MWISMQSSFATPSLHCKSCVILIEDTLSDVPGISKVLVDLKTLQVTVHHNPDLIAAEQIQELIESAWYPCTIISPKSVNSKNLNQKVVVTPWFTSNQEPRIHFCIGLVVVVLLGIVLQYRTWFDSLTEYMDSSSTGFTTMLVVGLVAGVSSCMAVVGGLFMSFASKRTKESSEYPLSPHIAFHIGRIVIFALGWGLLGIVWQAMHISSRWYAILFTLAGLVMLLSGLNLTDLMPRIAHYQIGIPSKRIIHTKNSLLGKQHTIEGFLLGVLTFVVPCGFTLAVQVAAIASWSFTTGMVIMTGFALGTLPGLLGAGWLVLYAKKIGPVLFRVLGVAIVAFWLYNLSLAYSSFKSIIQKPAPQTMSNTDTNADAQILTIQQGKRWV